MQVIPVLDLKGGLVVRGVAGRRQDYRPIVSPLAPSPEPVAVAQAFRAAFGLRTLYLADLDAIAGAAPAEALYAALHAEGFHLLVDAGVRTREDARQLARTGVAHLVLGLETLEDPATLPALVQELGAGRLVFSLDLKAGEPLGNRAAWGHADALAIAAQVVRAGVERLLVLDLAHVGVGSGTGTEALCRRLAAAHPGLLLLAGGGVRGLADLQRLAEAGVSAALVASALHDGQLTRADLAALGSGAQ